MDANTARFQWRLALEPRLGFLLTVPIKDGDIEVFFPMSGMEARGLLLALSGVPEVAALLLPEVLAWLARRDEIEREGDAGFLAAAGVTL